MKISRIWAVGNFATGKFREFLERGASQLSNGGFRLQIGPLLREIWSKTYSKVSTPESGAYDIHVSHTRMHV